MINKLNRIQELLFEAQSHRDEFYRKNSIRASVRYRRLLAEIKGISQEIRMEVLERKKQISTERSKKLL